MSLRFAMSKNYIVSIGLLIAIWIFAQFVYVKMGVSGDQGLYLSGRSNPGELDILNRTDFTTIVYSLLQQSGLDLFVTIFMPVLLISFLWNDLKVALRYQSRKSLFIASAVLPHFWIWQVIASKESLFIFPAMYLCLRIPVFLTRRPRNNDIIVCTLCLFLCFLIRPHYSISYLVAFLPVFLFLTLPSSYRKKLEKQSYSFHLAILVFLALLFLIFVYFFFDTLVNDFLLETMHTAQRMFLGYDGNTNRLDIRWNSVSDFFGNIYWGIPFSLIGFTPVEAINKPLFVPALIEGLVFVALIFLLFIQILRLSLSFKYLKALIVFGILPAFLIAILFHYPFGIFNPGSAIRYRQSLAPLLLFYPLSLIANTRSHALGSAQTARTSELLSTSKLLPY